MRRRQMACLVAVVMVITLLPTIVYAKGEYKQTHRIYYGLNYGGDVAKFPVTTTVKDGQYFTIPNVRPTRKGYTFKGWSAYRLNDKKWYVSKQKVYCPQRVLFKRWTVKSGWYTEKQLDKKLANTKLYKPGQKLKLSSSWIKKKTLKSSVIVNKANFVLYAQWEKNDGGIKIRVPSMGSAYSKPYKSGVKKGKDYAVKPPVNVKVPNVGPTTNSTPKPVSKPTPSNAFVHNIEFNVNGGKGSIKTIKVKDNGDFRIPTTKPTKSGYTFQYWYVKRKADQKWFVKDKGWLTINQIDSQKLSRRPYKPGEFYKLDGSWRKGHAKSHYMFLAVWKANAVSHNIYYKLNEGSWNETKSTTTKNGETVCIPKSNATVKDGGTIKVSSVRPSRTGYTFTGWWVSRNDDNPRKWYVNKGGSNGWETWDSLTRNGYTPIMYATGKSLAFDGSWTKGNGKSSYTFHAQWRPNTFRVMFDGNGGSGYMPDTKVTYGVKKQIPYNAFEQEGYEFDCWHVYRPNLDKWAYTTGTKEGWYPEGDQPAGYELKRFADGTWVSGTSPVDNDTVIFVANWIEDGEYNPPEPIDDPNDPEYGWTDWSAYSTSIPDNMENRQIESRLEYRYRDKQTVKSGRDSLSGYTKESTQTTGPSYGKWLVGQQQGSTTVTDAKKTVVTVESKSTNLSYAFYCKCKKVCWKTSGGSCKYCGGKTNYGKLRIYSSKSLSASGYKKDTDGSYFLPTTISKTSPGKLGTIYCMKWKDGHIDSFTTGSTVGGKNIFVWPDGTATLYRTKTMTYVNTFSKWGDWSGWSQTKATASGTRQVDTRTVYRYRDWVEQESEGSDYMGEE